VLTVTVTVRIVKVINYSKTFYLNINWNCKKFSQKMWCIRVFIFVPQNALKHAYEHLLIQNFFPGVIPPDPRRKGKVRRGGTKRGGQERGEGQGREERRGREGGREGGRSLLPQQCLSVYATERTWLLKPNTLNNIKSV
jgi:hypothetical protein